LNNSNPFNINNNNAINNSFNLNQSYSNNSLFNQNNNNFSNDYYYHLKYRNYPIHPRDNLFNGNLNENIKSDKSSLDYYKNKLEKEFNGDRKKFLESILEKQNKISDNFDNLLQIKSDYLSLIMKSKNAFQENYIVTKSKSKYSDKNPFYEKEIVKRKIKEEIKLRQKNTTSGFLPNKNKQFLDNYYNKIKQNLIQTFNDTNILEKSLSNQNEANLQEKEIHDQYNKTTFPYNNNGTNKLFSNNLIEKRKINFDLNYERAAYKTNEYFNKNEKNIIVNINNSYNNNFININKDILFKIDYIKINSNDINEEGLKLNIFKYYKNNSNLINLIDSGKLHLIKIILTECNKFEEINFYFIIISRFDFDLLFKLLIGELKKFSYLASIPEDFFRYYIKNFIYLEQLISEKDFEKVFEHNNFNYFIDEKFGEIKYRFFEFTFLLDYDKIKSEFLFENSKDKKKLRTNSFDNNFSEKDNEKVEIYTEELIDNYYPYFNHNKNYLKCEPSLQELRKMTKIQLKSIKHFSLENENGKVIFFENLDLINVDLDSIKLDYLEFEIKNLDDYSFEKLNRRCKVFLNFKETFSDDNEFYNFCAMLEKKYRNKKVIKFYHFFNINRIENLFKIQVKIEDFQRDTKQLILLYKTKE